MSLLLVVAHQVCFFTAVPSGIADPEALYLQDSVVLKKNDRLLMYTDGLLETTSSRNEPFGIQRLLQILDEYGNEPLEVLCDLIIEKSHEHANGNRGSR